MIASRPICVVRRAPRGGGWTAATLDALVASGTLSSSNPIVYSPSQKILLPSGAHGIATCDSLSVLWSVSASPPFFSFCEPTVSFALRAQQPTSEWDTIGSRTWYWRGDLMFPGVRSATPFTLTRTAMEITTRAFAYERVRLEISATWPPDWGPYVSVDVAAGPMLLRYFTGEFTT